MKLNEDYRDILFEFSSENVRFLLVGAYAMAVHGYPRSTMDIDLWVDPEPKNAEAVYRALARFGAPLDNLRLEDLTDTETIFQIGVAPWRIDILTGATALKFNDAFSRSSVADLEGIDVHVLSLQDLITNKRATGRTQDRADAEALESLGNSAPPSDPL